MIIDDRLEFCDATALNTGAAGTYLLGDVVDLQGTANDIGHGRSLFWIVQVDTLPTSGGAATAAFVLASDAQAAIAVDGTATEHVRTGARTIANLAAGTQLIVPLPSEAPPYERFLGVLQVTGVAAFTAGKINSFLTFDQPYTGRYYPDAQN